MIGFFATFLKVTRFDKDGKYVEGVYQECSTTTLNVMATVQPLSGKDLMLLPEGERSKESIRIYSDVELFTVNLISQRKADLITYRGKMYEVHSVKRWEQVIPHFACVAINRNDLKVGD